MRRGPGAGGRWLSGGVVLLLAALTVAPFLYMVVASLAGEAGGVGGVSNYTAALTALAFGRFLLNTACFAGLVVAGQVATSAAAAYAVARLRVAGRARVCRAL